jgi:cytochrome c oxidase assembly protein subunit 11
MAMDGEQRNRRSTAKIAAVVVAMFGFGYLLVPLYNVFCELTGLNGKTGRIAEAEVASHFQPDMNRTVKVQFVANNNADMPWEFHPVVAEMEVHPGQLYAATFIAGNHTRRDMVAQAIPSVAPNSAGRYFNKTECFCFSQQPLAAGETKEMPLRFIVDPRLPKEVKTLTLGYTLFDVTSQTAAK